jgi:hypothetical protein
MNELTRDLDQSERGGADVVQDMQKRTQEIVNKLVITMMEKQQKTDGHLMFDCVEDGVK